jgi:UrcA family protein
MKSAIIALAAIGSTLAATGVAAPALAKTTQTMVVEYSDLNLASAKGQEVLERRIDQAAKVICGIGEVRTGTRTTSSDARQCYLAAKAGATKQFAALIEDNRLGG